MLSTHVNVCRGAFSAPDHFALVTDMQFISMMCKPLSCLCVFYVCVLIKSEEADVREVSQLWVLFSHKGIWRAESQQFPGSLEVADTATFSSACRSDFDEVGVTDRCQRLHKSRQSIVSGNIRIPEMHVSISSQWL